MNVHIIIGFSYFTEIMCEKDTTRNVGLNTFTTLVYFIFDGASLCIQFKNYFKMYFDNFGSFLFIFRSQFSLQSYPSFWPDNTRSKKYGQVFTVEHMSHNHFKNIRCWTFRINKKVCVIRIPFLQNFIQIKD